MVYFISFWPIVVFQNFNAVSYALFLKPGVLQDSILGAVLVNIFIKHAVKSVTG